MIIAGGYIYPLKSNICLICALASKEARPLTVCTISDSKASNNPHCSFSFSTLPTNTRLVTSFVGKPKVISVIIAVGYIYPLKYQFCLISAQASKEARPLTLSTTSHIKICSNPHISFSFSTLPPNTRLVTSFVGKPWETQSYQ